MRIAGRHRAELAGKSKGLRAQSFPQNPVETLSNRLKDHPYRTQTESRQMKNRGLAPITFARMAAPSWEGERL
jgi:hypothetical protein